MFAAGNVAPSAVEREPAKGDFLRSHSAKEVLMANPAQASTLIPSAKSFLTNLVFALACALPLTPHQAQAQTYTVLHYFTGGLDGSTPTAGLTLLGTGNLPWLA